MKIQPFGARYSEFVATNIRANFICRAKSQLNTLKQSLLSPDLISSFLHSNIIL
ncbi:hypothetical protein IPA72_002652 [Escherichia coli]|nr:hypothetical protein [Escherichia coli]